MKIRCPGCGVGLEVDRASAGDQFPCPRCGTQLDMRAFERAAGTRKVPAKKSAGNPKEAEKRGSAKWLPWAVATAGALLIAVAGFLYLRTPAPSLSTASTRTSPRTAESADANGSSARKETAPAPPAPAVPGKTPGPHVNKANRTPAAKVKVPDTAPAAKSRKAVYWEVAYSRSKLIIDDRPVDLPAPASGVRLPALRFYLPPGTHWVSINGRGEWLDVQEDFFEEYRTLHQAIRSSNPEERKLVFEKLAKQLAKELLSGPSSLVLHHLGNFYYQDAESREPPGPYLAAAREKYIQAVRLNPGLAVSHLNLAFLYLGEEKKEAAKKEVRAAEILNCQNAFGIQRAIDGLKARLGLAGPSRVLELPWGAYADAPPAEKIDLRMVNYHRTVSRYVGSSLGRAKLWSNLGLYFARQQSKTALAKHFYSRAIETLRREQVSPELQTVLMTILQNRVRLAAAARLPEEREFEIAYVNFK